ncbi:MAG: DNA polymerase IV, partial [Pseudomonadales bacterium]|nr:DNA polymerase IV [Pseudomonadales bacterium]
PHAIIAVPRFDRYQEISSQLMDTLADFSPRVEALSMDEAFVEMTGAERLFGPPREMGRRIKQAVREATGLDISVGVASTKYVAKVASAHDKPDGLTVVPAAGARAWLAPLPVSRLWGAGPKTVPRLHALGLLTIGDVARANAGRLGSLGAHFHALANATDPRPVHRTHVAKSIGSDQTLVADVSRREDIELHLRRSADRIGRRLRAKGYVARGVRVRLKTRRFQMLSRQCKLQRPIDLGGELLAAGQSLLDRFGDAGPFRLVGMAAFDLAVRDGDRQLDLFEDLAARELETTVDDLMQRFGRGVLMRARDLAESGTVVGDGVNLDYLERVDGPA